MKTRLFTLIIISVMGSLSASGQVRDRVEKALNDPKMAENAAKADVYIVSKDKVLDSNNIRSQLKPATVEMIDRRKKTATCKKKS